MQKNEKPMDIAEVLARRKPQLIAKRAMDILLSACALAVLWPLLLLIALAVVIEKGGSGGALASTAVQILNAYFTSVDEAKAVVGENMLIQ